MNKYQTTQRGAALLLFLIFFMIATLGLTLTMSRGAYSDLATYRWLKDSKQTFATADALAEDVAYRFIAGLSPDLTEAVTYGGTAATATVTSDPLTDQFIIDSAGERGGVYRGSELVLELGNGASFNFGIQTGNGGFDMSNTAEVIGNVFSNGNVTGQGSSVIRGDIIAAGSAGYVHGIHATGSIYAHTIDGSGARPTLIEGDAYYQSINLSKVTVWGDLHAGWPDEATTSLPIPDAVVAAHQASTTEAIAAGRGTLIEATDPECSSGTYTIDTDTTFAQPTKIECDVSVEKAATTLTLRDTLWVAGNLTFVQGPTIEADPATSTNSVLIIADNPANRETSSKITVNNGTIFVAATSPKSYIVLLSMNDSVENGGTETAITMGQSSNGDVVVYAGHGRVSLGNQIALKEVTAYRIEMGNNSSITYESGLVNLNFTSGPGGGLNIISWQEQ